MSETLFLAVSFLDRFLSVESMPRTMLQLAGITSILVAAKYEEIYAPTVRCWLVSLECRAWRQSRRLCAAAFDTACRFCTAHRSASMLEAPAGCPRSSGLALILGTTC